MDIQQQIDKAVEILKEGGVIIYPTDTLWGIGCDATNAEAVEKIYKIKNSADKLSMLVLVRDIANVARYTGGVSDIAWELMEVAEEPLTMILPNATGVAKNLIPEQGSIGIRVPKHEFCERLLKKLNRPLVSTSVNISGEAAAVDFKDISKDILSQVDLVVDISFEGKPTRKASSIISIDSQGIMNIIR